VQAALMRCLAINPPVDFVLHRDASRLVDLFGLMVYERAPSVLRAQVAQDILEIYARWQGPMPTRLVERLSRARSINLLAQFNLVG
jgi:hypothetical protein